MNTNHLARCIQTLESSLLFLEQAPDASIEYEVYRNAVVKGFELTLESAGKLLRKALKSYTGRPRAVDELSYKEVLRHAAKHGLLETETVSRWFAYRENRNDTAHDYGVAFAEETLVLLPAFITDARTLEETLREKFHGGQA
jgi:nucleotidyltransferase substrate binding protein (TIGR01987 family)